jgi:hypothetical protein
MERQIEALKIVAEMMQAKAYGQGRIFIALSPSELLKWADDLKEVS